MKLAKSILIWSCIIMLVCSAKIGRAEVGDDLHFGDMIQEKCKSYMVVSLADITGFGWDKALFFPPYASVDSMYAMVGYKWRDIPELASEDQMAVAFIKDGNVVYDCFGYSDQFDIRSSKQILYAKDNPKFLVGSFRNGKTWLWQIDDMELADVAYDFSNDFSGEWQYSSSDIWNTQYQLTFTNEGFVYGYVFYSFILDQDQDLKTEYGSATFSGIIHENIADCKTIDATFGRDSNSKLPKETSIQFSTLRIIVENDKLQIFSEGSIPLNSGEFVSFSNRGYFTKRF